MTAPSPIVEDPAFERRTARWQRLGWIAIGGILLAAALGLFGRGAFNGGNRTTPDGTLSVHYPRFWRQQSPMVLRLAIDGRHIRDGRAHFWLNRDYLDAVTLSAVTPRPTEERVLEDGVAFVVDVEPGADRATVRLEVIPEGFGMLRGRVGPDPARALAFRQFIHP